MVPFLTTPSTSPHMEETETNQEVREKDEKKDLKLKTPRVSPLPSLCQPHGASSWGSPEPQEGRRCNIKSSSEFLLPLDIAVSELRLLDLICWWDVPAEGSF